MLKSMTGYGRSEIKENEKHFIVEIKSVNNRFCDVITKIPYEFNEVEHQIIKNIKDTVKRGRVEMFVFRGEENKSEVDVFENYDLAMKYYKILKNLQKQLNLTDDINLNVLMKFFQFKESSRNKKSSTIPIEIKEILMNVVSVALKNFDETRVVEGKVMYSDISERVGVVKDEIKKIEKEYKKLLIEYKNVLTKRIKELITDVNIDENRIAFEVALLAEKSDVSEEIVRSLSHIEQFSETLRHGKSVGRKLDFILQEMNREINTIGSKCNNFELSTYVINVKEELEKIREQVQNVE